MRHLIYYVEATNVAGPGPDYEPILASMRRASPAGNRARWVGPGPRVTRTSPLTGQNRTRVAWLYEFDDAGLGSAAADAALGEVKQAVDNELSIDVGGFNASQWLPYNPSESLNGPLDWWRDGRAATTRTMRADPALWGRLNDDENPIGPTTSANTPGNYDAPDVIGAAERVAGVLKTVAIVAGVGVGAYVAWRGYEAWQRRRVYGPRYGAPPPPRYVASSAVRVGSRFG